MQPDQSYGRLDICNQFKNLKNTGIMKRTSLIIAVLAIALIGTTSCSKDQLGYISVTEAEGIIPGTWKVNYYGDDAGGTADQFANYTFTFKNDGTVSATSGAEIYEGSWIIQPSQDEIYDQEIVLTINQMDILNQTWLVADMSEVGMQLVDQSGGTQVHFLKL